MGKLARLRAQEKMEAGILPIRIGVRERARDRKAREAARHVKIPFPKGAKPIRADELHALFDKAHEINAEVAAGVRAPVPVDLEEELLDPVTPEVFDAMKTLALANVAYAPQLRRKAASSSSDDESA